MNRSVLPAMIVVLALADALVHLSLDIFLFDGQFLAGFLNVLFLLNFAGYLVLTIGFVICRRFSTKLHRAVSLALVAYATATVLAWLGGGQDDLLSLGYVSKAAELTLIVALILYVRTLPVAPARRVLVLMPSRTVSDDI